VVGWRTPDRGCLFVVSGPSGVGKSTLIRRALERIPDLSFSVSATTRDPRPGEADGVHYHFLDQPGFDALAAADAFLERATVYDRSYGTLRGPTEKALATGQSLILDIDVQGAAQVRQRDLGAVTIFLVPPALSVLEHRLRQRGHDSEAVIRRRMEQCEHQLEAIETFDYLVINEDLATAHAVFEGILLGELHRRSRRESVVREVLSQIGR
jgi:guanylate kinase